jgi:hypothetical protein
VSETSEATRKQRPTTVYTFSGTLVARFILFLVLITCVVGLFGYAAMSSKDDQLAKASAEINDLHDDVERNQASTECRSKAAADVQVKRVLVSNALDKILAETVAGKKISEASRAAYSDATRQQDAAVREYVRATKEC